MNECDFNECRQTEIKTAEPLVFEHSASEIYIAIKTVKTHKSPYADRIPAELIKARGRTIRFEIHNLIHSLWNEEELPEQWKDLIVVPLYKKCVKTYTTYRSMSLLSTLYKI